MTKVKKCINEDGLDYYVPVEEEADWECLICGEEVADGELCKCLRDYKEENKLVTTIK